MDFHKQPYPTNWCRAHLLDDQTGIVTFNQILGFWFVTTNRLATTPAKFASPTGPISRILTLPCLANMVKSQLLHLHIIECRVWLSGFLFSPHLQTQFLNSQLVCPHLPPMESPIPWDPGPMKRIVILATAVMAMIGFSGCGCCSWMCPEPEPVCTPVVTQYAPACGPTCGPACGTCGPCCSEGAVTYGTPLGVGAYTP